MSLSRFQVLLLLLAAAGCSGPAATVVEEEAPREVIGALSDYETFDASVYEDEPAALEFDVRHDVPAALMAGQADAGIARSIQGYRIQLFSTVEVDEAVSQEDAIRNWWRRTIPLLDPDLNLRDAYSVYRIFKTPYYRVRLGDFATRDDAEAVLAEIQLQYPGAFVVPDQVTVIR